MERDAFNAYHKYLKSIEPYSDAERGRLFTALLIYSSTGEVPEFRGNEKFAFAMIKEDIDSDKKKYLETCEKRAKSARKRWNAFACNCMQMDANGCICTKEKRNTPPYPPKEKNIYKKATSPNGDVEKKDSEKRFSPPKLEDVRAYCRERGSTVDPDRFYNYYASNGWYIGRSKMKDWRRAVITWELKDREHNTAGVQPAKETNPFFGGEV